MADKPAGAHGSDYRPEIDGLRAVAVLAVALFHAELGPFTGGFVGVDVFFVISGFLITGIIWRAVEQGRFSLVHFYERRVRRIMPALVVVTLAIIAFTLLYKTPREARTFGESLSFLGLFASNFFFMQERGYFDAPLDQFALLHSWSLAVEEQFYIVFPLLLMAVGALAPKRVRGVVWVLTGLSFIAAAITVTIDKDLAFFASPLRFWELSIGALLAVGAAPTIASKPLRETLSWIGALLIAISCAAYDKLTPFPGLAALAPCLGAALIIHANAEAGRYGLTLVGRGLSLQPVVFIGLASYSFYLWHWPALSFAQYATIRPLEAWEAALVLLVSFGLAVLSLYFVERPFRSVDGVMRRRPLFVAAALCLLGFVGLGVALQESKGWPQRLPADVLAMTTGDAIEFGVDRNCLSEHDRLDPKDREAIFVIFCRIGDVAAEPKTLIWGDSHSLAMSTAFDAAGKDVGASAIMTSRAACPPVTDYDFYRTETWEGCTKHNRAVMKNAARLGVERVVLIASWAGYTDRDQSDGFNLDSADLLERRLRATVEELQALGMKVVLATPVQVFAYDIPSAMARTRMFGLPDPVDRSRAAFETRNATVIEIIRRVADAASAEVFPLHEQFCDAETCATERDGRPLYADHGHINILAAQALKPDAARIMGAAPSSGTDQ